MDLLAKTRVAVLSKFHTLLDTQVQTPEGVAQMIRDLESAIDELAGSVAGAAGSVTGLQRDIAKAGTQKAELESDADLMFADDDDANDASALELQARAEGVGEEIEAMQGQLAESQALHTSLSEAMGKLNDKHAEMVAKLRQIRVQDAGARAKEKAVSAITNASGALDSVDGGSVDNVAAAIQARADKADARLDGALGRLQSASGGNAEKDARLARAKAALLARQHKVTEAALQDTPAPAGTHAS